MARWRVDIIGKELQNLGTVDAPNAWEALAKAVDLFDIHPALRSKTVSRSLRNRSRPLSANSLSLRRPPSSAPAGETKSPDHVGGRG
jgi:hypothetical protein